MFNNSSKSASLSFADVDRQTSKNLVCPAELSVPNHTFTVCKIVGFLLFLKDWLASFSATSSMPRV